MSRWIFDCYIPSWLTAIFFIILNYAKLLHLGFQEPRDKLLPQNAESFSFVMVFAKFQSFWKKKKKTWLNLLSQVCWTSFTSFFSSLYKSQSLQWEFTHSFVMAKSWLCINHYVSTLISLPIWPCTYGHPAHSARGPLSLCIWKNAHGLCLIPIEHFFSFCTNYSYFLIFLGETL